MKIRSTGRCLFAVATVIALSACAPPPEQPAGAAGTPVATVNDTALSADAFAVYVRSRTDREPADLGPEERERLLDEAIQLVVVADAARAAGLADEARIRGTLELQRHNTLAQSLIRDYLDAHPVTDEAIQARYSQDNAGVRPMEYKARHILLASEEAARGVISELDAGADFADLARAKSTGPSASSGGDLGWFTSDQMVAPFSQAVAAIPKGSYSKQPVQTQFGWHVILAEDSRQTQPPPLEQIREQLRPKLQQESIEAYIKALKDDARIDRNAG